MNEVVRDGVEYLLNHFEIDEIREIIKIVEEKIN